MVNIALISYLVINDITERPEFFSAVSQRMLACNSILAACENEEVSLPYTTQCSNNHAPVKILRMTLYICTNVLLNNLCSKKNDQVALRKLAKKRKLQTLQ